MKTSSPSFLAKLKSHVSSKKDIESARREIIGRVDDLQDVVTRLEERVIKDGENHWVASYGGGSSDLFKILERDKSKKSIFLFGAHDYGNVGDLAIGYSQEVFIRKYFNDYNFFTLTRQELLSNWQIVEETIGECDVIMLYGGGNLGDLWPNEESARRRVVERFKGNPIVLFPQSIKFESDEELQKSADIYNSHANLMILTRDDNSFQIATKYFQKANHVRGEDMVMSYSFPASERVRREGLLFVERNDKEKGADTVSVIKSMVDNELTWAASDTVIKDLHIKSPEFGPYAVYDKIDEIGSYDLVVTNRLHGAIFALLAGRPVIVVDNSYGKISGALKNISKTLGDRIVFAKDDASNVNLDLIKKMCAMPTTQKVPSEIFKSDFEQLSKQIRQFIETK